MPRHTATTRKSSASTKKAAAASTTRKVGVIQIAREALMDALSAVVRAARRALAAAREVGTLALEAVRQIAAGTTAGLGEVFGTGRTTKKRRAAART